MENPCLEHTKRATPTRTGVDVTAGHVPLAYMQPPMTMKNVQCQHTVNVLHLAVDSF